MRTRLNEQAKKVINGPRPSPLVINKYSHLIRKPCEKKQQQIREPIIIYTQSPKIIHTKAQDFMALVQRLTGMSKTINEYDGAISTTTASDNFESSLSDGSNNNSIKQQGMQIGACDGDETSSVLRRDDVAISHQYYCPSPSTLNFADMPLFTPTPSEFFRSSRSVYRYSDSPFGILGSLISPSGLEFIRELPEY